MEDQICKHLLAIKTLTQPKDYVCEECIKNNGAWLHLRTCQECGATLCCDSSPAQHASKHADKTGHPVVISAEPGERWMWCYVDEEMVDY
jgi:hypothetical protein